MEELKHCPFCGKCPEIALCDNEGNVKDEEYERDPWSGLGYRIVHISEDCPVATDEDGGSNIYDTREEAERHWNRRAERTCRMEYNEEWSGDELYPTECYNCSECHHMTSDGMPSYCPNCGARVIEEES